MDALTRRRRRRRCRSRRRRLLSSGFGVVKYFDTAAQSLISNEAQATEKKLCTKKLSGKRNNCFRFRYR